MSIVTTGRGCVCFIGWPATIPKFLKPLLQLCFKPSINGFVIPGIDPEVVLSDPALVCGVWVLVSITVPQSFGPLVMPITQMDRNRQRPLTSYVVHGGINCNV